MTTPLKTFQTAKRTAVTYFTAADSFLPYPVWSVEFKINDSQEFYIDVRESDRPEGGYEVVDKDAYPDGFIGLAVRAVETFEQMRDAEDARAVAETQVVPLDELLAISSGVLAAQSV